MECERAQELYVDHLTGRLMIDLVGTIKKEVIRRKMKRWHAEHDGRAGRADRRHDARSTSSRVVRDHATSWRRTTPAKRAAFHRTARGADSSDRYTAGGAWSGGV